MDQGETKGVGEIKGVGPLFVDFVATRAPFAATAGDRITDRLNLFSPL